MKMNIPLFKPKFREDECASEITECLRTGWTGYSDKCVQFEKKWSEYTNLPNSHFLNSNTSGLHLALEIFKRELNWQDSDEILTTPVTFISTNHSIIHAGLKPVFVDIDDELCMSPSDLKDKITEKTKAVIFVGIGGNVGELESVTDICRENNLLLILDAAHMAGTFVSGHHVGREADCAVFSFQAVKNLPTADSGMICFRDEAFDQAARRLSWMGISKSTVERSQSKTGYKWYYDVNEVGYKYHGNAIMASLGMVALNHLDADNAKRRDLAEFYTEKLSEISGLEVIQHNRKCVSSRHLFQIRTEKRNELQPYLQSKGINSGVHYRNNLLYPMYASEYQTCPNAARLSEEVLSLPLFVDLTESEMNYITESLGFFFKK